MLKAVAAFPVTSGQPFVAINTAAAGVGIASSIKATQKGLKALGKGGATQQPTLPSGGGSAAAPSLRNDALEPEQPQLFSTGNNTENNQNNVIKAVVVESDITTVQNRINDIENSSEIGG